MKQNFSKLHTINISSNKHSHIITRTIHKGKLARPYIPVFKINLFLFFFSFLLYITSYEIYFKVINLLYLSFIFILATVKCSQAINLKFLPEINLAYITRLSVRIYIQRCFFFYIYSPQYSDLQYKYSVNLATDYLNYN